ncbi:response regulator [Chitinimonas sp. BJB300]|uniref:response regulator n=1 Tax=Chitinimonas sp. BJB300 TaxID=1559339 RepID=UPI000C0CD843|nr:response regulator transcription factor [Chitinimonas sp. BJB300]PHV12555.1 DNA-binding response regulator [Chitinimonas sp. BJB300]TSJ90049.1 response regulator transcription factor [Chitinimonas sp. BJB300]
MIFAKAAPYRIRLMLVDDHPLVRDGLRARLGAVEQIDVVGEAGSGEQTLQMAEQLLPDLMLVDIGMKDMNGICLTELLLARLPSIRVLILSMYDNAEYVISAMHAGAKGYVLKDAGSHEIIAAINAVAAGGTFYSAAVADVLLAQPFPEYSLTEREREVLILLAKGLSNKAIAQQLEISVRTVETHRLSIRRKLGIDSAAGLVKYALEQRWLN